MTPENFNIMIEKKIFTNGADCDKIVKPKYEGIFRSVIQGARTLDFSGLGWGNTELASCMAVIASHCPNAETLKVERNEISVTLANMRQYLSRTSVKAVDMGGTTNKITGDIADFLDLDGLTSLALHLNRRVRGDIASASGCLNLKVLKLYGTEVAHGSILLGRWR